jgi:hypothetical protein
MDEELPTYRFVASWILIFTLLVFANKSRIGHVIIYYTLLLAILFILVTEFRQIAPFLIPTTVGELQNSDKPKPGP